MQAPIFLVKLDILLLLLLVLTRPHLPFSHFALAVVALVHLGRPLLLFIFLRGLVLLDHEQQTFQQAYVLGLFLGVLFGLVNRDATEGFLELGFLVFFDNDRQFELPIGAGQNTSQNIGPVGSESPGTGSVLLARIGMTVFPIIFTRHLGLEHRYLGQLFYALSVFGGCSTAPAQIATIVLHTHLRDGIHAYHVITYRMIDHRTTDQISTSDYYSHGTSLEKQPSLRHADITLARG